MDYEQMIQTGRQFYKELAENNTKDWWSENRATYDDVLKPGALALLQELKPAVSDLAETEVSTKLFRPYRDVRFSKDKTPYKPHLHILWQTPNGPAWFFGMSHEYLTVGGGVMSFEKPVLDNWRKFVDLDADRVAGIFAALTAKGFVLREPALKRVPSPYPADHPNADHLRRKACVATRPISGQPLTDAILSGFRDLKPMNDLLTQVIEA